MGFFQYGMLVEQVASTAAAGGTTTLVNTSKQIQVLTASGSNSQIFQLPGATTMTVGQSFDFYNSSAGTLTINNNSSTTLYTVNPGSSLMVTLVGNGASAGTWVSLANGSASAGGSKNYISSIVTSNGTNNLSGNFESGSTSSFSLANSALSSFIPTATASPGSAFSASSGGSAASGNLSLTIVSSGQLGGTYSGDLASSAASTAGDMMISNAFNIDTEDKAKVMTVSFSYSAISGTMNFSGSTSNTHAVWIYDVTNALWIMPAGVYNLVQGSGVGQCVATFQTSSNSTQYQLALININATGGAYSLYVDEFSVGPQVVQKGPAMSDWNSNLTFTASAGFGTITNNNAYTRRVGDSLETRLVFTVGTTTTATAYIQLPSGYTLDTTKFSSATQVQQVGTWVRETTGATTNIYSNNQAGPLFYDGSTNNQLFLANQTNSGHFVESATNSLVGASDNVSFIFTIPIAGWSSNSVQSSDTATNVVAAEVAMVGSYTAPVSSPVIYDTVIFDTNAAYSTSTGLYTCPVSGYYRVSVTIQLGTNPANVRIAKNGTAYIQLLDITSSGSSFSGDQIVKCVAGDTLAIWLNNARAFNVGSAPYICTASFERVSGPAVVTATESVNASYYCSANAGGGPAQPINFDTKIFDTNNAATTSPAGTGTWKYTAPVSGKYSVTSYVHITTDSNFFMRLYKNGAYYKVLSSYSSTGEQSCDGSAILLLNAGDYIDIRTDSSYTVNGASLASDSTSWVDIARVGN